MGGNTLETSGFAQNDSSGRIVTEVVDGFPALLGRQTLAEQTFGAGIIGQDLRELEGAVYERWQSCQRQ